MVKVFIDPGHGGGDPGAVGNGLKEKDLTLAIALECRRVLLEEYEGIEVKMSRTGDTYPSLSARAKMANDWKARLFVSIHVNAGGGTGFESYIFNGGGVSAQTIDWRNQIHKVIAAGSGFKDRGQKKANFQVLRETKMPAILTENGFIDHKEDAAKLRDPAFLKKLGLLHAEGIAKALGLKKKPEPPPPTPPQPAPEPEQKSATIYRVVADGKQTGAFAVPENLIREVERVVKGGAKKIMLEKV